MGRRLATWTTVMTAAWIAAVVFLGFNVPLGAQNARWGANYFPDATLITQDGKPVRFYEDLLKGKIVAINMIYTSCKFACPLETARLAQVQKLIGERMGRDVFFYSISIDPENDTPAVLKAYAEKFGAGPGWLFLTGKKAEIDQISKKLGLYSEPGATADGHTPHLLIGNETTGQWIRNNGLDNPRFLATTIGSWLNSWQTAAKPTKSYAEAPKIAFNGGEYAFRTHCSACHTVGGGDGIGPDLINVTTRRERGWLTRFILTPDKMIAERDPLATELLKKYKQVPMPALGLAKADAELVMDFLAKESARRSAASPTPAAPAPAPAPATATRAIVPPAARATATGAPLTPLLDPYLRIQQALNGDSVAGVEVSARTLAATAAKLGAPAEAIRAAAQAFGASTPTLKDARAAFGPLSDAMVRYSKEQKVPLDAGVKLAYCPMADKYWLQRGDTIRNPFYGRSMSDCGRFVVSTPATDKGATW